jgi:hypothetical protein
VKKESIEKLGTRCVTFCIYPTKNQENTLVERLGLHVEFKRLPPQVRGEVVIVLG